jgi:K+-sensing histidine kinase KdpD
MFCSHILDRISLLISSPDVARSSEVTTPLSAQAPWHRVSAPPARRVAEQNESQRTHFSSNPESEGVQLMIGTQEPAMGPTAWEDLTGVLFAAVSHDMRGPLTSIKAAATSLLWTEVDWDAGTARELATLINEQADQLDHLLESLLDLSRTEAGMLKGNARASLYR